MRIPPKKYRKGLETMKRFISIILCLMLVLSLATTVFADENADTTTYEIVITGANPGHTYEAYQIFTGKLHAGKLSDIMWGASQNTHEVGAPVSTEITDGLTNDTILNFIEGLSLTTPIKTSTYDETTKNYTIADLPAGYYLVKDMENTLAGDNAAYTDYIIKVVADVSMAPKSSVPSLEKKVNDINDSTQGGSGDTNQDSADFDIGDHVPYHIHVKLNNHLESYDTYKLVITDTMSKGLTYDEGSMVIKLGDVLVPSENYDFNLTTDAATGETKMVITFENIKTLNPVNYGNLTIDYTATLNANAVVGSEGNPNTAYLEFSNNPSNSDELGKTPEDEVTVFTFKLLVNKVDADNKPLNGAEFTLFKKIYGQEAWSLVKTISGATSSEFSFDGLDDGIYRLVETITPAGYNTISPIEFEITASHTLESANPVLEKLDGKLNSGNASFTVDLAAGSLSTNIVNKSGATLPETGGMGTTVLYIAGAFMVLAAGVLLITKKRMSSAE